MDGRVAVVTGAGTGIGRTTALAFATQGAFVAVVDINQNNGEETVALIEETGQRAIFVKCDVAKADDVKAMIETVAGTFGRLDFACNNAGIGGVPAPLADVEESAFDRLTRPSMKGLEEERWV